MTLREREVGSLGDAGKQRLFHFLQEREIGHFGLSGRRLFLTAT